MTENTTELERAQTVGGIASNDATALVDLEHANTRLPQAGDWLPSDLAAIRRLLERIYAEQLSNATVRRTYTDVAVPLVAGIEHQSVLDARPYGYTQVAISATTAANIELRREGVALAVVLTPGRFVTIQQPVGTKITLKAGDPQILATFRYSDQVFGTVAP